MSDVLDKFFASVAPTQETSTEAPRSLFERFIDSIGGKPSPAPSKPPVEAPRPLPEHSIDTIFPRLIDAESKGVHMNEKGVLLKSKRGAEGITQLMPTTAAKPGYGLEPVKDKSEAEYTRLGKQYLQKMYDKFGDWEKALAAYNAGVGNVMKAEGKAERFGGDWKDHLPRQEETIPYIQKIMQKGKDKVSSVVESGFSTLAGSQKPVDIASVAAGAVGDKVLDVTGSPAVATGVHVATELAADPLNAIPPLKGGAALIGAISFKDFIKKVPEFANTLLKDTVFHGTSSEIKGGFNLPKEGTRQLGIHFGSKEAANDRLKASAMISEREGKSVVNNIHEVFLNVKKPLVMDDPGIWRPKFIIEQLEKESLTPQQKVILEQYKRNNPQAKEVYSNTSDQSVRKLLQDLGFDSVKYQNMAEGRSADWSYIVLDPKQIKSAISPEVAKVGAEKTVSSSFIPSKYIKTPFDPKTGYSSQLNNPIHLSDDAPSSLAGARLSGFTDSNNKYFHGYDKNGERFTIAADRVNPDWITTSKDSNKTAEYFRNRLKGK